MLTDRQLRHYRTFGFVVLRNLFTADEVATLRAEYEEELDLVYADQPFTGETRYWTMMLHPRRPLFAGLLEDDRFCSVAEQLYGPDAIGICTDANRYVGDTHWHPDHTADREEDCFGVKFAFYLDPVSADTGALRVIPGSHNRAYHEQVRDSLPALTLAVADVPAYVCASESGRRGGLRHALLARQPRWRHRPPHGDLRLLQQPQGRARGSRHTPARSQSPRNPGPVRPPRTADVSPRVAGQPRR